MSPFDEHDRTYQRMADAIRYLLQHAADQPRLADVAAAVHLSEYHLQRLFTQWTGVSPKRFLQQLTVEAAKTALGSEQPLQTLSYELGLSGSSRLHDLFVTLEAMTPGEYRQGGAGLVIHWSWGTSRFGPLLAATTPRGVCALQFLPDAASALAWLHTRWPQARLHAAGDGHLALRRQLFEPLSPAQPLSLHLQGSNFQIQVWRALLSLPYGSLASYGQLATRLGKPGAARAVGNAVGANPVAWLIPCHRVIRAGGACGGYRWGETRKLALLGWEAARSVAQTADDPA